MSRSISFAAIVVVVVVVLAASTVLTAGSSSSSSSSSTSSSLSDETSGVVDAGKIKGNRRRTPLITGQQDAQERRPPQYARDMPGGYSPVNVEKDVLVGAADFAVSTLINCADDDGDDEETTQTAPPPPPYTFLTSLREVASSPSSSSSTVGEENKNPYDIEIIDAWQQVVAGINFNILVALYDHRGGNESDDEENEEDGGGGGGTVTSDCIGSFRVTVYDRFGQEMSVSEWGEEMSCHQVHAVMENESKFDMSGGATTATTTTTAVTEEQQEQHKKEEVEEQQQQQPQQKQAVGAGPP